MREFIRGMWELQRLARLRTKDSGDAVNTRAEFLSGRYRTDAPRTFPSRYVHNLEPGELRKTQSSTHHCVLYRRAPLNQPPRGACALRALYMLLTVTLSIRGLFDICTSCTSLMMLDAESRNLLHFHVHFDFM
jgi:hypothetical protein